MTHGESGEVINTTVVSEEPAPKQRVNNKKNGVKLIYCRSFTPEYPVSKFLCIENSDFHLCIKHPDK